MSGFKPGTLACRWRKNPEGSGPDLVFFYPSAPDGHLLHSAFNHADQGNGRSLVEELEKRGYDIATLQFTIRRKSG